MIPVEDKTLHCPACGRIIPDYSGFCPFCGKEIPREKEARHCPKCDGPVRDDSLFCSYCGASLPAAEEGTDEASNSDKGQDQSSPKSLLDKVNFNVLKWITIALVPVVLLVPWFGIDYLFGSIGFNLFTIGLMAGGASSLLGTAESALGTSSGASGLLSGFSVICLLLGIACVILLIADAVKDHRGEAHTPWGAIVTVAVQIVSLALISSLGGASSGSGIGITVSFGWWITIVIAACSAGLHIRMKKSGE